MESTIGIALLGRGTVGGGIAALLETRRAHVERSSSAKYCIVGIAGRERDPLELLENAHVDLVVEAIGGTGIALECIERALELRKHVVTANKDAIGTQGPRLRALAAAKGVTLRYEASVASAVPIISTLDGALAGDEVFEVGGILNGTCNFILGLMSEGATFSQALEKAQQGGYAEADPASDVDGIDAGHKLAILLQHAFGARIVTQNIPKRGIRSVTSAAVRRARQHGYELKLAALARRQDERIYAEVAPVLVPFAHPFARARGVENVIRVVCAAGGPLLFSGAGAGREAAASAMLGDIVAALKTIAERRSLPRPVAHDAPAPAVIPSFDALPRLAGYPILGASERALSAV